MTHQIITPTGKNYITPPPQYPIAGFKLPISGWYTNYKDPVTFTKRDVGLLFAEIAEHEGVGDISIAPDYPVLLKVKGKGVYAITHRAINYDESIVFADTLAMNNVTSQTVLAGKPADGLTILTSSNEFVDERSAYNLKLNEQVRRYRYNMAGVITKRNMKAIHITARILSSKPVSHTLLELEADFMQGYMISEGLSVLSAGTAQGKTTTLGATVAFMLESDPATSQFVFPKGLYMTLEDPQELDFSTIVSNHSTLYASQIGKSGNIENYSDAIRAMMRRSPDFAMVGELRDFETISSAVELSLAGCGVIATTHANDIPSTFRRLITRYPLASQTQVANDLLQVARMFGSQRLIWTTDPKTGIQKRKSIREYLLFTDELKKHLNKFANNMNQLYDEIDRIVQAGDYGVRSFTKQANYLYAHGQIDLQTYYFLAKDPQKYLPSLEQYRQEYLTGIPKST